MTPERERYLTLATDKLWYFIGFAQGIKKAQEEFRVFDSSFGKNKLVEEIAKFETELNNLKKEA